MAQGFGYRMDAPFRQYKKTDEEVRADGYQTGLEWPAKWNHLPGGPYYPRSTNRDDHPDWIEYCRLLEHHNKVWLDGWLEGFAANAKTNFRIRRLRNRLLFNKLASA